MNRPLIAVIISDIAGTGTASAVSMKEAILLAAK